MRHRRNPHQPCLFRQAVEIFLWCNFAQLTAEKLDEPLVAHASTAVTAAGGIIPGLLSTVRKRFRTAVRSSVTTMPLSASSRAAMMGRAISLLSQTLSHRTANYGDHYSHRHDKQECLNRSKTFIQHRVPRVPHLPKARCKILSSRLGEKKDASRAP